MNNTVQLTASTATPLPVEQSISTHLTVEIMRDADADDGSICLVAATDSGMGDLQEVTPDQALARITAARAVLDQQEALALSFLAHASGARTRTFEDATTGQTRTFPCAPWCNDSHLGDTASPTNPVDVSCTNYDRANTKTLPVGDDGGLSGSTVLSTMIQVDHFHPDPANRIPHALVEIAEDQLTDPLDPNQLMAVIELFDERVTAMRARHAELLRIRAEFSGPQQ